MTERHKKKLDYGLKEKLIHRLKYVPIRRSLKELFLFTWLLPFVLVSVSFLYLIYHYMFSLEMKNASTSLSHTQEYFDKSLSSVKAFSDRIYVNKKLHDVLQKNYSNNQDVFFDYTSLSFFDDYLRSCDEVSSFRVYTENYTLLDNSFIIKVRSEIQESGWYKAAVSLKGQNSWFYVSDSLTKKNYLCAVRSLWSQNMETLLGVLVVNVSNQQMNSILDNQNHDTVISFGSNVIYSTIQDLSPEENRYLFSRPSNGRLYVTKWRGKDYNGVFSSGCPLLAVYP